MMQHPLDGKTDDQCSATSRNTGADCTRHLTTLELALRWAMSPRTLERWRQRGWEPLHISLPGKVVYRLADIEAYEASRLSSKATAKPSPVSGASIDHHDYDADAVAQQELCGDPQ